MTLELIREFFLWCTVINVGLLFFTFIMFLTLHKFIFKIHGKLFHIPEDKLYPIWYKWIGYYKIGVILFNLVPYIVLLIIG